MVNSNYGYSLLILEMDTSTVKFLENAVKLLKQAKRSENIDCVINHLRFKALEFSTCVPHEINPSEVCMHCGNVWRDGLFSINVKGHNNNIIRKKIRNFDQATVLSPCRKEFFSYYKSQKDNILVKKCSVCKTITKHSMSKPINKTKKEDISLKYVENHNLVNRARKRKSGKKQSFAGLSPAAVLQAKLSSGHTKVDNQHLSSNDPSKTCELANVKNFSVSRLDKNTPLLSNNGVNSDKTIPSTTIPQIASQRDLSSGTRHDKVKKRKLKNDTVAGTAKKSSKKKRKSSFLNEVLSFL